MSERLNLGSHLADLRKKKGWSQKQLIEEIRRHGVRASRSAVANAETNQAPPSNSLLRALEKVYGEPLMMYGALMHAETYCTRFGITINQYLAMVRDAASLRRFS